MALPDSGFTGPPPIEVGNPPDIPPQPAGREWTPFGFDVPRNSYGGGGFERVFAAPAAPALPFMRAPASSASVVATQPGVVAPAYRMVSAPTYALSRQVFGVNALSMLPDYARPHVDAMMRAMGYMPNGIGSTAGQREYLKVANGMTPEDYLAMVSDPTTKAWLRWFAAAQSLNQLPPNYGQITAPVSAVVTAPVG